MAGELMYAPCAPNCGVDRVDCEYESKRSCVDFSACQLHHDAGYHVHPFPINRFLNARFAAERAVLEVLLVVSFRSGCPPGTQLKRCTLVK